MENAKHGGIVDYAMPMMKIETLMRQMHDHCLKRQYPAANALCPEIITEARVLAASLALMEQEEK
jgi:hypothetical protein